MAAEEKQCVFIKLNMLKINTKVKIQLFHEPETQKLGFKSRRMI